jgi:predicted nucleic acid-binding protein
LTPALTRPRKISPIVLDSSCWLEYFAETPYAARFEGVIASPQALIVPVITIYEVVKKTARERGQELASIALTLMQQGQVVDMDLHLALAATTCNLPLADSLIYATAQAHGATLWTQDQHFDGLPGVKYFPKNQC